MSDTSSNHSGDASDNEEKKEAKQTIAEDLVVTKYKMAAEITNKVLKEVVEKCIGGASSLALCTLGNARLNEETEKVFKKEKKMKKGLSFPTCISANNCICHFSPLKSDPDYEIKDGDLIKIDLGCHVDGFIAVAAHTFVVGATKENPAKGKKADAVLSGYYAQEAALRLLKPGSTNTAITEHIDQIATAYKSKPVEGMLSYQLARNVIDGEKRIIQNPSEMQKKDGCEKCEFGVHEVYALDVLMSSGDGKPRESEVRTTVYKKKDIIYQLRMKTSRAFLSEAEKRFALMPFTLRDFEDEKKARLGVLECAKHELMEPYPVFYEKDGEFVSEFKSTVLLMPNGTMKITGLPLDLDAYQTENKIEDKEINALLETALIKKKNNKNKNKKKAAAADKPAEKKEEPKK